MPKSLVMVVMLAVVFSGCASTQTMIQAKLPENAKVVLVKPDKDYPCPQTDRLTCIDFVAPPDPQGEAFDGFSAWMHRRHERIKTAILEKVKESGGNVAIATGDDNLVKQSFGGVSFDFVTGIALNLLAGKAGSSASTTTKTSLVGASQGVSNNAKSTYDTGIVVNDKQTGDWRMIVYLADGKEGHINCPEGVEKDPKACLSVLAQALVTGSAKQ